MSFTETCLRVAQQFIQTVVVIDDQGFTEPPPAAVAMEAAYPDVRGFEAPASAIETNGEDYADRSQDVSSEDPDNIKHGLDGKGLTRRFAEMGINCAVYVPNPDGSDLGGTGQSNWLSGRLARRADIVVVDWLLDGRTSQQARDLIRHILAGDQEQGGRLRLLAVYTGEDGLKGHRQDLRLDLNAAGIQLKDDDTDSVVALSGAQLRVVFLHKDHDKLPVREHVVPESELPARLVEEFSRLAQGIMPSVALAAITAVRDGTHNILAKFNRSLDPALAAHRSMLDIPSDAEDYALGLISEELHMRLEGAQPDNFRPTAAVFNEWVDQLSAQGRTFNLTAKPESLVNSDVVKELLAHGTSQHATVAKGKNGTLSLGRDKVWRNLTFLFSGTFDDAACANLTFARMALLRREAFGLSSLPKGWRPTLTLGSIVALMPPGSGTNSEVSPHYFVCLQPLCDAAHLKKERAFPLLPLKIQAGTSDTFSLVVRVRNGQDLKLHPKNIPNQVRMVVFAPTNGAESVRGEPETDGFRFHDVDNRSFEWLGEMRSSAAQRIVQQFSSQFSRVGLDEFEWLRQSAGR